MASLRARIALEEKRPDDARSLSTGAYDRLHDLGGHVPAIRSEEIVFTHARVLDAVSPGSPEAARLLRRGGRDPPATKADSLSDAAQRDSLLQRVRLSRAILSAAP